MADPNKPQDEQTNPLETDAPEVEAEIVEPPASTDDAGLDGSLKAEEAEASDHEDSQSDETVPPSDGGDVASEGTSKSPGMILFFVFILVSLGIIALFQMSKGRDIREAAKDAVEAETPNALPTDGGLAAQLGADSTAVKDEAVAADVSADAQALTKQVVEDVPVSDADNAADTVDAVVAEVAETDPAARAAVEALKEHTEENPIADEETVTAVAQQEDVSSEADAAAGNEAVDSTTVANAELETAPEVVEEAVTALDADVQNTAQNGDAGDATPAANEDNLAAVDGETGQPVTPVGEEPAEQIVAADGTAEDSDPKIANAVAGAPAAADGDAAVLATQIAALKEQLRSETEALNAAVAAGRAQTEEQSARITELRDSLEQALNERDERANAEISALRAQLEKINAGGEAGGVPAGRQAAASLALLSVQRAVNEGAPYADELEVLARLTPESVAIERLRASAEKGAPTLAALKAQFEPALREALIAATADGGETNAFAMRLQRLISVRPATPQQGDSPKAIISRAEYHLERDHLDKTVEELSALSDGPAEAFAEWLGLAKQRVQATAAIEALNAALLSEYQTN